MRVPVLLAALAALTACESSAVRTIGGLLDSDRARLNTLEECAAFNGAVAANLTTSVNAREAEVERAPEFRNSAEILSDRAVKLRVNAGDETRQEAFGKTFRNVSERQRELAIGINDRIIADGTGVLDNPWVREQQTDCRNRGA
ncbi:MAG: hypothetical protein ACMVY4_06170 [Minwuia sp.]|uniref:hypothetical protein n=1 Tax=Minwuia sp. TaxID=2493630 RepID=UPI003A848CFA